MIRLPPRRILAAVDLSKASVLAWSAAREIADRFGAPLEAVWCVEPSAEELAGLRAASPRAGVRRDGLRRLRAALGPGARVHCVNGEAGFAIPRLARDRGVDLVVMGAHRRGGLARWAAGSAAESVARASPCPVLLVPRAWRAPRRILAPVSPAAYARRGLRAAVALARAYRGRVAILEVVRDPVKGSYAAKRISDEAAKLPAAARGAVRPELEVRAGRVVEEILEAGRDRDLIVLVAHRKSLLGDFVIGTTAERVLRHSRVPVLAIPSR